MTIKDECVLGAVNEQRITANEARIGKLEGLGLWMFSTSMGTLLTAIVILIKELV